MDKWCGSKVVLLFCNISQTKNSTFSETRKITLRTNPNVWKQCCHWWRNPDILEEPKSIVKLVKLLVNLVQDKDNGSNSIEMPWTRIAIVTWQPVIPGSGLAMDDNRYWKMFPKCHQGWTWKLYWVADGQIIQVFWRNRWRSWTICFWKIRIVQNCNLSNHFVILTF